MRKILTLVATGALLALPIANPARASASARPACSDGVDNDADGLADYSRTAGGDPECTTLLDDDEGGEGVLSLDVPTDTHLDFYGPLPSPFRHQVTVRNNGLVPAHVTLVQSHSPIMAGGLVLTFVEAPSTSAGSCQRPVPLADFVCDLGRVLPGASVVVESTLRPAYMGPTLTYDLWVTTSVTGTPVGSDRVDTNVATTAYNITHHFGFGLPPL